MPLFLEEEEQLQEEVVAAHPALAIKRLRKFHAANGWSLSLRKQMLDAAVAVVGLAVAFVPGVVIYLLVRATSQGPGFFQQKRVGYGGRLFTVYKFRTMEVSRSGHGPGLTRDKDPRITAIGKLLRKFKLDELPQFYNVLRGEMSLVGPRPKLPQYAAKSDAWYRPGITGFATLFFRDEEELLRNVPPEELDSFYELGIKPLKARADARYMRKATFASDAAILFRTVFASLVPSLRVARRAKPRRETVAQVATASVRALPTISARELADESLSGD